MRYEIDVNEKPTKEQIDEIRKAAKTEVVCDEDCPELSLTMIKELKTAAEERRQRNLKHNLTLRVSQHTLEQARRLGKGYTSILSRILDDAFKEYLKESGSSEKAKGFAFIAY